MRDWRQVWRKSYPPTGDIVNYRIVSNDQKVYVLLKEDSSFLRCLKMQNNEIAVLYTIESKMKSPIYSLCSQTTTQKGRFQKYLYLVGGCDDGVCVGGTGGLCLLHLLFLLLLLLLLTC